MRILIFAFIGLLFLGGAGAGAYMFFVKPAQAAVGETEEHKETKEAKKKNDKHEIKLQYVELNPLILPIVGERGVTQTISLVVMVEVDNPESAAKVTELAPRLTDAYIQSMYGVLSRKDTLKDGVVQVAPLKDQLNGITHKVLGEGVASDVLLQVVQQRRI